MGRDDFHLLSDDEIRNALDVAACKLCEKLWPKLLASAPELSSSYSDFFDQCKLKLAKSHGLSEMFEGASSDSRG